MVQLIYIDETGASGTPGSRQQPYLTLVGILVDEDKVKPLAHAMTELAWKHLGWVPNPMEFHGNQIWHGQGHWHKKQPAQLLAVLEDAIELLESLDLAVAHATIDKKKLHERHNGTADRNAYRLALQFLVEKIDQLYPQPNRILIADEAKHEQARAVQMVAHMQAGHLGEVPGRQLQTIIDSLHYVDSAASAGVQLADLVAYVIQRSRRGSQGHPDADAAVKRMSATIASRTPTWRDAWPR